MSSLQDIDSDESNLFDDLPEYPLDMARTSKNTRQNRCERCILQHRQCDGQQPICTTCSQQKIRPACIYPEGQPSRSELQERKKKEAAEQKATLDQQEENRKAAGITYGFGTGQYGTVPNSWAERYGGGGSVRTAQERQNIGDGVVESEEQKRKRRRLIKKPLSTANARIGDSSEEEIDITQPFPSLAHGAPSVGPMEDVAPRAPSLGTPFDPFLNPESIRNGPGVTPEMIGRNLADSIERNMPKHQSGTFKGLSDWTGMGELTAEDINENMEKLQELWKKICDICDKHGI